MFLRFGEKTVKEDCIMLVEPSWSSLSITLTLFAGITVTERYSNMLEMKQAHDVIQQRLGVA